MQRRTLLPLLLFSLAGFSSCGASEEARTAAHSAPAAHTWIVRLDSQKSLSEFLNKSAKEQTITHRYVHIFSGVALRATGKEMENPRNGTWNTPTAFASEGRSSFRP